MADPNDTIGDGGTQPRWIQGFRSSRAAFAPSWPFSFRIPKWSGRDSREPSRPTARDTAPGRGAHRIRPLILGALGGILTALCWLPLGLAFLMPLAMLPVLRGFRRVDRFRDAVLFGLVFEAALVTVGAHYILALLTLSWLAPVLLAFDIAYHLPFALAAACGGFW